MTTSHAPGPDDVQPSPTPEDLPRSRRSGEYEDRDVSPDASVVHGEASSYVAADHGGGPPGERRPDADVGDYTDEDVTTPVREHPSEGSYTDVDPG